MSSLKDLASLIMIPSLYEDGELHTVKPLADENIIVHPDATGNNDGNDGTTDRTDANFTFSRGSNLAATRVDVNGLIEKGRENLVLQSNQFDTTWVKSGVTLASGQAGYDGTNNAWEVTRSTSAYSRLNQLVTQSGLVRHSVYAKAGTLDWVSVGPSGGGEGTWFNISTGVQGEVGLHIIDSSIEDIGSGWYRISVLINNPSNQYFRIYPANVDGGDDSTTAGTIYIQDAQLEAGLVATDYIETGASTAQAGILEDMPRLDYSGSCPALLLEPQRTNLLNHGEYFGAWTLNAGGTGSTPLLEANTTDTLSPEGKYNAYKVTLDAGAGTTTSDESIMYRSKSGLTAGSDHTASVYLKGAVGGEEVIVRDTSGSYKKWTLTTEWARYDYTQIAAAASYATSFGIRQGVAGTINSDAVVYIYGFQSELGSYPTSYIPTYGASVTRSYEGTLAIGAMQSKGLVSGAFSFMIDFKDIARGCSSGNFIYCYTSTGGTMFYVYAGSIGVHTPTGEQYLTFPEADGKFALVYDGTDVKFFKNGAKYASTYTASTRWADMDDFRLYLSGSTAKINYNQTLFFDTALTDSECIALTTL